MTIQSKGILDYFSIGTIHSRENKNGHDKLNDVSKQNLVQKVVCYQLKLVLCGLSWFPQEAAHRST